MLFAAPQGNCPLDFGSKCLLPLPTSPGPVTHSVKCGSYHGTSRGDHMVSYSDDRSHKLCCSSNILLKISNFCSPRRLSVVCSAGNNSYRRNPDFSRQQRGSSRGKSKQYQEREDSENSEETDFISSKNGSLLSLANNPRYQATAVPGRREKEIVELFRKVQAQLRERAAVKEEKKIEAAQQGQSERGTVDSLLKLLRKHSVDQKKKRADDDNLNHDPVERSNFLEDEQNLNHYSPDNIKSDDVHEPSPSPSVRPVSNFRRKSPVPRVKFQPVFTAENDTNSTTVKSQGKRKKNLNNEAKPTEDLEPLVPDGPDDASVNDQLDHSESDKAKDAVGSSVTEGSSDLGTLKLSELRDLAKSRGIKGYSKLKKVELVELLSG